MNTFNTLQTKFNEYPTILKCIAYLRLYHQKNPKIFKITLFFTIFIILYNFGKSVGAFLYYLNH
jgi:hypothetical protein